MRRLLEDAAQRAISYLENLDNRRVTPPPEAVAKLSALDHALPERPDKPETALKILDEICSPATIGISGRRFFGFVIGGSQPATLAANWLAGAWDQNSALYNVTPGTAYVEQVALRWLLDLLHLPPECGAGFVTGATVANFCALAAARHAVLERAGWNVESDGLIGAPPITVIAGAEAHPTLTKSVGLLGLGRDRVMKVPVDSQGRLRADALPRISGPTIVCAQAGNVNTGAIDPVGDICEIVHRDGAWVHVDGAFGLWAMAIPSMAKDTRGMANADSWGADFHKWLNVPYDSGIAIVRNADTLRAAMAVTAEYLPTDSTNRNPSDYVPELSRRARGVEVWAALHTLGRSGLVEMIERNCRQARRFAEGFKSAGYEILNDVVLNQVLVSFGDPAVTNRVIAEIQKDGTCWCGGTVWQGQTAMRISVCSFATTDDDVELSLKTMLRIVKKYGQ